MPYAQAILYNYFSSLKTYPVMVNEQNVDQFIKFMKLSLEMGGFPLCKVSEKFDLQLETTSNVN